MSSLLSTSVAFVPVRSSRHLAPPETDDVEVAAHRAKHILDVDRIATGRTPDPHVGALEEIERLLP
jgi:hypothetical protein